MIIDRKCRCSDLKRLLIKVLFFIDEAKKSVMPLRNASGITNEGSP